jgi:hypothetical protein
MTRINMTRSNALRNIAGSRDSVAWGSRIPNAIRSINASPLIFAAVLIVCSLAIGCSREKPKPVSSNNQTSMAQAPSPSAPMPAPAVVAENKPAPKKVVHRKPATVNYSDKTYGVTFEYPRRYAIETGDAASDLVSSSTMPMNFVAPGGIALAAVELPETGFANTDFSSAFFDVSVHKTLTADQCNEFAVPQPKVVASNDSAPAQNSSLVTPAASAPASASPDAQTAQAQTAQSTTAAPASSTEAAATAAPAASDAASTTQSAVQSSNVQSSTASSSNVQNSNVQGSKLMLGDLELLGTESVSGEGTRQTDSKYFHVYQNGACYEFAINVTTDATDGGLVRHVDRDKVFSRLEQILATVKINPVTPDTTAETPAAPAAPATPAQ